MKCGFVPVVLVIPKLMLTGLFSQHFGGGVNI